MEADRRFLPAPETMVGQEEWSAMSDIERQWVVDHLERKVADHFARSPHSLSDAALTALQGRPLDAAEQAALTREVEGHASILKVGLTFGYFEPCFDRVRGAVFVPPLTTDTRYVAAMHELGHAATTHPGVVSATPECEADAWRWAMDRISIPQSQQCRRSNLASFASYLRGGDEPGVADVLRWLAGP